MNTKLKNLYTSLVRSILEYSSIVWNAYLHNDIELLTNVQRRCERMCNGDMNFESLELRRNRINLVKTYTYLHGHYAVDTASLFQPHDRVLRGHSLKLHKPFVQTDTVSNFFAHRVITIQNDLPSELVTASLDTFVEGLKR